MSKSSIHSFIIIFFMALASILSASADADRFTDHIEGNTIDVVRHIREIVDGNLAIKSEFLVGAIERDLEKRLSSGDADAEIETYIRDHLKPCLRKVSTCLLNTDRMLDNLLRANGAQSVLSQNEDRFIKGPRGLTEYLERTEPANSASADRQTDHIIDDTLHAVIHLRQTVDGNLAIKSGFLVKAIERDLRELLSASFTDVEVETYIRERLKHRLRKAGICFLNTDRMINNLLRANGAQSVLLQNEDRFIKGPRGLTEYLERTGPTNVAAAPINERQA